MQGIGKDKRNENQDHKIQNRTFINTIENFTGSGRKKER